MGRGQVHRAVSAADMGTTFTAPEKQVLRETVERGTSHIRKIREQAQG